MAQPHTRRPRAGRPTGSLLGALVGVALCVAPGATALGQAPPGGVGSDSIVASALDGVVTDAAGRVLAGAVVAAEGLETYELSSQRGTFTLRGLPPGPREFVVRRVGFTPAVFQLDVPPQATVHVRVTMQQTIVQLGTVVVDGEHRSLGLFRSGFYERAARQVQGYFYPPEEILRRNMTTLGTLLGEIPGLQLDRRNNEVIAYGRDVGANACPLNVWVDGALASSGEAPLDQLAPAQLVRAVEVYPQASGAPGRYLRPGSKCGALVIWTKGVVRELF